MDPYLNSNSNISSTPITPENIYKDKTALDVLMDAGGNVHLAAERLHTTVEQFLSSIALDAPQHASVNQQLRELVLLQSFVTFQKVRIAFEAILPDLPPAEISKALNNITTLVTELSTSSSIAPVDSGALDGLINAINRSPSGSPSGNN